MGSDSDDCGHEIGCEVIFRKHYCIITENMELERTVRV
jgi:hypothetical protein